MDNRSLEHRREGRMSRRPLPDRRRSWTQKINVGGQTAYVSFGEYEDGTLGEVWIEASKAGTFARGVLSALAIFASTSLQFGMPVKNVVENMKCLSFEPCGNVKGLPNEPYARSLLEVVGRLIEQEYPCGKRRDHLSLTEQVNVGTIEPLDGREDVHSDSGGGDNLRPVPHPTPNPDKFTNQ